MIAAVLAAQTGYPRPIYRSNDVSKSLNLSQDQIAKLNEVTAATQARYRDDFSKLGTLPAADRNAREMELNQKYSAEWNKAAQDVFDNRQLTRYQQLSNQYAGFNTFYNPEVQKQMTLSADQLQTIQGQRTWSNEQLAAIYQLAATDPTRANQMYRDYWNARQERLNKFLNTEQQKAWGQMTGEPHTPQIYTP